MPLKKEQMNRWFDLMQEKASASDMNIYKDMKGLKGKITEKDLLNFYKEGIRKRNINKDSLMRIFDVGVHIIRGNDIREATLKARQEKLNRLNPSGHQKRGVNSSVDASLFAEMPEGVNKEEAKKVTKELTRMSLSNKYNIHYSTHSKFNEKMRERAKKNRRRK